MIKDSQRAESGRWFRPKTSFEAIAVTEEEMRQRHPNHACVQINPLLAALFFRTT